MASINDVLYGSRHAKSMRRTSVNAAVTPTMATGTVDSPVTNTGSPAASPAAPLTATDPTGAMAPATDMNKTYLMVGVGVLVLWYFMK